MPKTHHALAGLAIVLSLTTADARLVTPGMISTGRVPTADVLRAMNARRSALYTLAPAQATTVRVGQIGLAVLTRGVFLPSPDGFMPRTLFGTPISRGSDAFDYLYLLPVELATLCDGGGAPGYCTEGFRQQLDSCMRDGCSLEDTLEVGQPICGGTPPAIPIGGGCDLVNDLATNKPAGPAEPLESVLSYLEDPPFTLSHQRHGTLESVTLRPDGQGRFVVESNDLRNRSLVTTDYGILTRLFDRFPNEGALTIVQDGQEYVVVKVAEGTIDETRLRIGFIIRHPDGFTFEAGDSFGWGGVGPNDIMLGDPDFGTAIRPLADGTYRVLFAGDDLTTFARNTAELRELFGQLPAGVDRITLVLGDQRQVVTRPPGTPPSTAADSASDRRQKLAAALLAGDGTVAITDSRHGTDDTIRVRPVGVGKLEIVDESGIRNGRVVAQDRFLTRIFDTFPNDGMLTIVAGGREYLVTKTPPGTKTNGLDVSFILTDPDGFNFTAGPWHVSTGVGPNDVLLGDPDVPSAIVRPLRDGSYRVVDSSGGTPLATDAGDLSELFAQLPNTVTSITLVDNGRQYRATRLADGKHFLVDTPGGTTVYLETGRDTPLSFEVPFTDDGNSNRTYRLPDGTSFEQPAPGVSRLDVGSQPGALATTPEQVAKVFETATSGRPSLTAAEPQIASVVVANGLSTGPGAFNLRFMNGGKPAYVPSGEVVLAPVAGDDARRISALIAKLPPGTPAVSADGYCLQKNERPPADGEIYTLAPADQQQAFNTSRRILASARRLRERNELKPDSDADAYFHSIVQWSIWTDAERYDEAAFTKALIGHTRENLEAAGQTWTAQIEKIVGGLAPGRFADIQRVLAGATG